MAGMIMTNAQIWEYYREIRQHPKLVLELTEYQKSKIKEYADNEWGRALMQINEIMIANPNYQYPENLNNKYIEYWTERLSTATDAKKVLNALATYGEQKNAQPQPVQSDTKFNELQIQTWEYRLRDFIYMATRYDINAVYAEVRPGFAFSTYFQDHVVNARTLYEHFKAALRTDLISTSLNTEFYGKDIQKKFLPMIDSYEEWYNQHKSETEIFKEYNPYALMWNIIKSTRDEILKYFPNAVNSVKPQISTSTISEAGNTKVRTPLQYITTALTDEEEKEFRRNHEEDAKKPLEERRYLSVSQGLIENFANHFDEFIQEYLHGKGIKEFMFSLKFAASAIKDKNGKINYIQKVKKQIEIKKSEKDNSIGLVDIEYSHLLGILISTIEEEIKGIVLSNEPKLTERETVLIHCYKQRPAILSGETGYSDYMKLARPTDRLRYPGDSKRKADSLIRSIDKILSYLTPEEKQQAENEISTIQANFS